MKPHTHTHLNRPLRETSSNFNSTKFRSNDLSDVTMNAWIHKCIKKKLMFDDFSGERVLRSRQHERGTSQERRYKRSHRRSPSSGRQHGHRDRDRTHLAHPTSSRRVRIHRHHGSSSPSQERHRHRSPSSRSQVSWNSSTDRTI